MHASLVARLTINPTEEELTSSITQIARNQKERSSWLIKSRRRTLLQPFRPYSAKLPPHCKQKALEENNTAPLERLSVRHSKDTSMFPSNHVDLLTLDKQNSRFVSGRQFQLGDDPPASHHNHGQRVPVPHHQIKVSSTIDADIVLRRVIEDRAAILALQSRAAANLAELAKAKTRQNKISDELGCQDREIARLTSKAKLELAQYNQHSKAYVRAFALAFERGDLDILPHHPFAPSLEKLEEAINLRKAKLIEKVQADDRVKKLQAIDNQEKVTEKVLNMNREAFVRAVELAKQQYNESARAWLDRANALLATIPRHEHQSKNRAQRPQEAPVVFTSTPPQKQKHKPRHHHHRIAAQNLGLPPMKKVNPDIFMKQPLSGSVSPDLPKKRPVDIPSLLELEQVPLVSPATKRQKVETPPLPPKNPSNVVDLCLSPAASPPASNDKSHDAASHEEPGDAPREGTDDQNCAAADEEAREEISIARVLTDMHDRNEREGTFAVANI